MLVFQDNFFMLSQGKKREKEEKERGKREEERQDSCDEKSFRRIKC
jgi:hypothetical protein